MTRKLQSLISAAHGHMARGEFEKAIEVLEPARATGHGARAARLEALSLAATASGHLAWYEDEVTFRRERLGLVRECGSSEAKERAALAIALTVLGRHDEAEEVLAPLSPKWGRLEWAETLRARAMIVLRRDRDYAQAAALACESLALLEQTGATFERGRVLVLKGHVERLAGQVEEGGRTLAAAQAMLADLLDSTPLARIEYARAEFFLGDVHRDRGDCRLAEASYRCSRTLLGRRESMHGIARYYERMALLQYMQGRYAETRRLYLHPELLSAIEKIGNMEGYLWCYLGACAASAALAQPDQAQYWLTEARKCAPPRASAYIAASIGLAEGAVACARGEYDQAHALYADAAERYAGIGADGYAPGICDALTSLGELEIRRGNLDAAREYARRLADLSLASGHLSIQSRELFIKSAIMAEGGGELDAWFHDIMARLAVISSPVTLFKVISNLYHYGRKFTNYKLDVSLENKIKELKLILDDGIYHELYREYMDRRFMKRIEAFLLGTQAAGEAGSAPARAAPEPLAGSPDAAV